MTLFVINPNSSDTVTAGIDAAMAPLRSLGPICCITLAEGPPGIESQAQSDAVVAPLLARAAALESEASGFVIACFGDPGLAALREQTSKPALGIQEAGLLTALTLGDRVGVISILPGSIARHRRSISALGLSARVAGDRALGLGVSELADRATTLARMEEVADELTRRDGADVLLLGCAGMVWARAELTKATGLPVVEPCQAAAAMALGQIALAWHG